MRVSTSVPKLISLEPLVGVIGDIVFVFLGAKEGEFVGGGFH
jgi:hypothetical protein